MESFIHTGWYIRRDKDTLLQQQKKGVLWGQKKVGGYMTTEDIKERANKRRVKEDELKLRVTGMSKDKVNKVWVFINKNLLWLDPLDDVETQ